MTTEFSSKTILGQKKLGLKKYIFQKNLEQNICGPKIMGENLDKKTRHLFLGQMLHGQMSPEQLCLVKDGPGKINL